MTVVCRYAILCVACNVCLCMTVQGDLTEQDIVVHDVRHSDFLDFMKYFRSRILPNANSGFVEASQL
jgi:hypothetical protein